MLSFNLRKSTDIAVDLLDLLNFKFMYQLAHFFSKIS